jgi:hypothetical protein
MVSDTYIDLSGKTPVFIHRGNTLLLSESDKRFDNVYFRDAASAGCEMNKTNIVADNNYSGIDVGRSGIDTEHSGTDVGGWCIDIYYSVINSGRADIDHVRSGIEYGTADIDTGIADINNGTSDIDNRIKEIDTGRSVADFGMTGYDNFGFDKNFFHFRFRDATGFNDQYIYSANPSHNIHSNLNL